MRVTSKTDPLFQQLLAYRDEKPATFLFLEGDKLIYEAQSAGLVLEKLVVASSYQGPLFKSNQEINVPDRLLESLSFLDTPPGVLAMVRPPQSGWDRLFKKENHPILILDGIQDPGNLAAMFRTAEAAGASGVITTEGTARVFSPKALRGAMGSSFRLPFVEHQLVETIVTHLKEKGYRIFSTSSHQEFTPIAYDQLPIDMPLAFVLGQESMGVAQAWDSRVDGTVLIPIETPVESLNVGAAAAVILFEWKRRRASPSDGTSKTVDDFPLKR